MPVAETIAVISCICSIIGAAKTALEVPDLIRKRKNNQRRTLIIPPETPLQVDDGRGDSSVKTREYVNALTRIAELQRGHIQGQRALIEDEKKLILSQRELIADHRGLVSDMMALSAQQWIMLEKAVWIISCLAVALISTSFLLASNSFHSRYWPTYRSWDTLSDFDTAIPDRMFWMPPWHSFNLASLLDGLSLVWLATNAIHQAFLALTISIFPVLPPGALVVWVVSTGLGRSHRLLVPTLSMFSPVGAGIFRAYIWGYWVESLLASTALDTVCMVGVIFMLQMAERKKALQN